MSLAAARADGVHHPGLQPLTADDGGGRTVAAMAGRLFTGLRRPDVAWEQGLAPGVCRRDPHSLPAQNTTLMMLCCVQMVYSSCLFEQK